jgi:histidine triad (HIT) family protein
MDCIFCKIIKGDIPCTKVYEDENILSFLDIAPANKGHCLVVPKEHYETLIDAPEEIINYSLKVAKKIARAMSASLANEGFNVLINNNKVAGQLVPHVHMHIIPRFKRDGVRLNWTPKRYKDKEIVEFADKIKKFL